MLKFKYLSTFTRVRIHEAFIRTIYIHTSQLIYTFGPCYYGTLFFHLESTKVLVSGNCKATLFH